MDINLIGKSVTIDGYVELGVGVISEVVKNDDYPYFVEFDKKGLHESEKSGQFNMSQLKFI